MLRIRTLARRTIIAASGHGRQRGECELAGGRVLTLHQAWWGAGSGGERGVTGVRRVRRAGCEPREARRRGPLLVELVASRCFCRARSEGWWETRRGRHWV
eukprot:scaffold55902_cov50-Phaeocystis_antarctica.AAC.2